MLYRTYENTLNVHDIKVNWNFFLMILESKVEDEFVPLNNNDFNIGYNVF